MTNVQKIKPVPDTPTNPTPEEMIQELMKDWGKTTLEDVNRKLRHFCEHQVQMIEENKKLSEAVRKLLNAMLIAANHSEVKGKAELDPVVSILQNATDNVSELLGN